MMGLSLYGEKDVRYEESDDPVLSNPEDVLVKMTQCSICGSDLHLYHGARWSTRPNFGLGHEAIGEVVEVGREVKRLKVGDQVMLPASTGCGKCSYCAIGLVGKCEGAGMRVYGIGDVLDGCQAEAIIVPTGDFNAIPIPDGVTPEQALMLTDALPTAYLGCINGDIGPGKSVVIIGLGPIGLLAVECAFALGASRVFAVDLVAKRREAAQALGAIPLDPSVAVESVRDATAGRMVDCTVEVVGATATVDLAIALTGVQGSVSVIGANIETYQFPMMAAFMKGLTFRTSICSVQQNMRELIALVQGGRIRPERVISHRMKLSEGATAYDIFDRREDGAMKMVLVP